MTYPNVKGQVGVYYTGVNPPSNTSLFWKQVDLFGTFLFWKEYRNGNWEPIGNVAVVDTLISLSTTDALSANQGRVLKALLDAHQIILNDHDNLFGNYQLLSGKNQPGGYVGIDPITGKIPPALVELDGLIPVDVWLANSGNPPTATPNEKEYWIVIVAGNYNLGGFNTWEVGDRALFLRGVWNRIPAAILNTYNALDQLNAGFALDARQGKILKDFIDALDQDISDNASAINALSGLVAALQVANTTLTNSLATKQGKIIRLPTGTITNEKYSHNDLAGIQYGQLEVIVNGTNYHLPGFFTKVTTDNFITIPGEADGAFVQVKIYPL